MRDLISKCPKYREPHSFSWKYNFKLIMDSVEEFARKWAKQEEVESDTLSEWVKSVKHHLKRRIYMVSRSVNTKPKSTLDDPVVSRYLEDLHDHFVIVPADKAPNNVVFICKAFYYSCLREELRCIQTDAARVKATQTDFLSRSAERPTRPRGAI